MKAQATMPLIGTGVRGMDFGPLSELRASVHTVECLEGDVVLNGELCCLRWAAMVLQLSS